jgi:hypothetical protein
VNLVLWHDHGHIGYILNQIPIKPDFILLNDYKYDYRPIIRGLETLTIPYGIIMHDMQYKLSKRELLIQKEKPNLIFTPYRDAFKKWFPNHINKLVWFPHHVPDQIFKDYSSTKTIPMLMAGAVFPHIYPLRHLIVNHYRSDRRFRYIEHPGYQSIKGGITGEAYAKLLNEAKIFFTCDSVHKFPVLKFFEVLACQTLLLAPESQELIDLGFIDQVTYAVINEMNFAVRAEYYLANEDERNRIAQNGYELIQQKHTTAIRAQEMVNAIQQFLQRG